eukprot:CAMPEP_0180567162 /NCGR_PEP_ID=MMETSP1037_2-20121125/6458_1 /TAXON_ID=632150 /ORGANISM="Azadinium spinosum, Strain 3D9" /LENGTH=283 /DNA_ID=CAMNT_0022584233 /DNA_START=47 /DNA_END=894 /DNA_ORIENTATION=-
MGSSVALPVASSEPAGGTLLVGGAEGGDPVVLPTPCGALGKVTPSESSAASSPRKLTNLVSGLQTSALAGTLAMESSTAAHGAFASSGGKDIDGDLRILQNSYWYASPRSLVAFRHQADSGVEEVARQTVWWIERVEQRFLFGYSWDLLSDAEVVKVRRLTISVAPDQTTHVWAYNDPFRPLMGTGTYDGKKFTVHMADGALAQWAHMVSARDLNRLLPGCTVSIKQLTQELYPVPEALSYNEAKACCTGWPLDPLSSLGVFGACCQGRAHPHALPTLEATKP